MTKHTFGLACMMLVVLATALLSCVSSTRNADGSVTTQQIDPAAAQALVILLPEIIDLIKDDPERADEVDDLTAKLIQVRQLLKAAGIYEIYAPNGTVIKLGAPPIAFEPWGGMPNG